MDWHIEFTRTAEKHMRKLSRQAQTDILDYLRERVRPAADARQLGKALHGDKQGLWRYRVGDYRIICNIEDQSRKVVVLAIGHRKDVYRRNRN
ncbi:MAG TPA: type II toxin-antitoxin system RelE/ParE family toxin [Terriglobia bacterium]|nr:type II toxin-antitoxin system RelE/ParE family toxin [Terriglobia bacterium]